MQLAPNVGQRAQQKYRSLRVMITCVRGSPCEDIGSEFLTRYTFSIFNFQVQGNSDFKCFQQNVGRGRASGLPIPIGGSKV